MLSFAAIMLLFAVSCIYRGRMLGDISFALFTSSVYSIITYIVINYRKYKSKGLVLRAYFVFLFRRRRKVRISISYLYRIVIRDPRDNQERFLLITNAKWGNVTPVGGTYKYFDSAEAFLKSVDAKACVEAEANEREDYKNDLRLILPVNNLWKIFNWFDKGFEREYDVIREFYEELIDSGLCGLSEFKKLNYSKYASHKRFHKYNKAKGYYEIHQFDVFQIFLNGTQESEINTCIENCSKAQRKDDVRTTARLYLASEEEIRKDRLSNGLVLGDNAKFVL